MANSCQKVLLSAFFERKRGKKKKLCADRGPPLEQARLPARLACGSLIRTVFYEATVLRLIKFERRGFFTRCSSRTSSQTRSFSVLVHEPCVPVGKLAKQGEWRAGGALTVTFLCIIWRVGAIAFYSESLNRKDTVIHLEMCRCLRGCCCFAASSLVW